ncbi:hypothetical protein [Endozoicomonas lisbonensis]|uniref:OTU domain-containing protein n=1 Tax=Endozoicomonas lisbonensis TaxID=3120522 RepID=A0ABV2SC06_9GAMM
MQIQNPVFQLDTSNQADFDNPNTALLDATESQPDSMCQRVTRFVCRTLPEAFQALATRLFSRQASILDDDGVMTYTAESRRGSQVTPEALEFFENFSSSYWPETSQPGIDEQIGLINSLKEAFPDYFKKNPFSGLIFEDKSRCNDILEGIANHYQLDLAKEQTMRMNEGWKTSPTIDNGDCLYDAIWQGLDKDEQKKLQQETGKDNYTALKEVLKREAGKYNNDIMANNHSINGDYDSLEDYLNKVDKPEEFWGRHAIEGKILAQELGFNLVLKGGCSYEAGWLNQFVEREDEKLHWSEQNTRVVYIANRKQHYSAIFKD